jgi:hypothetical protein
MALLYPEGPSSTEGYDNPCDFCDADNCAGCPLSDEDLEMGD